ncbi:alanine racemase, partial [Aphanothece microscopica]|uniref:alanine racemase n=1 Tax=Aphanothece microscopica TaxID=1049561 RepID=UPI003984B5D6
MPTRRRLVTMSGPALLALSGAGNAVASPVAPATDSRESDRTYFAALSAALNAAGEAKPTLVIDRDRLAQNLATMQAALPADLAFRLVVKSLPSPDLLAFIMRGSGSRRLMEFHQPFLSDTAHRFPDTDILLGKPLPVGAAARFYDSRRRGRPHAVVHWLIDSAERLAQYSAYAAQTGRKLDVALEIDVGFHRGGFATPAEAAAALTAIK